MTPDEEPLEKVTKWSRKGTKMGVGRADLFYCVSDLSYPTGGGGRPKFCFRSTFKFRKLMINYIPSCCGAVVIVP